MRSEISLAARPPITRARPNADSLSLSLSLSLLSPLSLSFSLSPNNVFSFQKVTQTQVLNAFNNTLAKSHGNSPDNLPLQYLSQFFTRLLFALTLIFNRIIETGIYPESWKLAYIVPLNKCPQPTSMNDTRPIANLPHLAKIFDKLITIQIRNYLESHNLFNRFQSGFRTNHSTQTYYIFISLITSHGHNKAWN